MNTIDGWQSGRQADVDPGMGDGRRSFSGVKLGRVSWLLMSTGGLFPAVGVAWNGWMDVLSRCRSPYRAPLARPEMAMVTTVTGPEPLSVAPYYASSPDATFGFNDQIQRFVQANLGWSPRKKELSRGGKDRS